MVLNLSVITNYIELVQPVSSLSLTTVSSRQQQQFFMMQNIFI